MSDAAAVARAFRALHQTNGFPDYEKILEGAYSRFLKPGDTVVDVGAHAGRHFRRFVEIVGAGGTVIGFEPIPQMFDGLRAEFGDAVRNMALSSSPGRAKFIIARNAPEESGLRARVYNTPNVVTEEIQVIVETLDNQLRGFLRVDYIKMDIEGAEIDCLRGGENMLRKLRPIISVEYGSPSYSVYGHQAATLFDWASGHGYAISDMFGNVVIDAQEWLQICDVAFWDFFLLPAECADQWQGYFK